ncbi:MAG: ATP-binding cassette domain-containing protein [Actinomycetota bacterium]
MAYEHHSTSPVPVLEVRDLRVSFELHAIERRVEALRGVSLSVAAGEHVALAGSSGAGKSSLLKSVYRTYLADSGEVVLHRGDGSSIELGSLTDRELLDVRAADIGYVSQFLRAEPRRSALDVVTRAGLRRGLDADQAADAAVQALREVNLVEELWHTYPTLLSGGEKQRVNLAAGTIAPPRLLLLDEPISSLDPTNREAVLDRIAHLTELGVAVLAVFHDGDAMRRLADRVVVLDAGLVVDAGPPDLVLAEAVGVAS